MAGIMPGRRPCRSHGQADFWNPTGQPGGEVRGAAAQLDDVKSFDITKGAYVALGCPEQAPRHIAGSPGPRRVLVSERRVHQFP